VKSEKVPTVCSTCGFSFSKRKDRVRSPDFCNLKCRKEFNWQSWLRACAGCGSTFKSRHSVSPKGETQFCSVKCFRHASKGENNPCWKGGRFVNHLGYVILNIDGKQIPEHRYLMAKHIGRSLRKGEVVHHKNEIKHDNRIENLELMTVAEHMRLHSSGRKREGKPGESNHAAKLTARDVLSIRKSSKIQPVLAKIYGVSQSTISLIRLNKTWTHV